MNAPRDVDAPRSPSPRFPSPRRVQARWLALSAFALGCSATPPAVAPTAAQAPPVAAPKHVALDHPAPAGGAAAAPLLAALGGELARSFTALKAKATPPPYYVAYQATDAQTSAIQASLGALFHSTDAHSRLLDVDVRVGDPKLDNTHPIVTTRDSFDPRRFAWSHVELPVEDDADAIHAVAWKETESRYRDAAEQLVRVTASKAIKVADEDAADDFSSEPPSTYLEAPATLTVDLPAWQRRVIDYSTLFRAYPDVHDSSVSLQTAAETRYLVTSEGTREQLARTAVRLMIQASTTADDGMALQRFETMDVARAEDLPTDAEVRAKIQLVIDDLLAMRKAPLADAFVGPAILEGRAAGVTFHEIFGHRVEGHRQKDDGEGQTFAKKVGQPIMPDFISVYDDPTASALNGTFLNGFYRYDDEGVPAQRASLVDGGVLKGFLLSRSPTRGFTRSNGHGRRQAGHDVVARQGNLVVDASRTTTPAELKRLLLEEVARQGKPYGLRFRDIQGGFTGTQRGGAQTFKVLPIVVYRVYPDGHEEMVRGVDIEGTPLTSLSKILAAANDVGIFNGFCGAESGFVPVSASSPSLLVGQIEVARRQNAKDKPPILPPPALPISGGTR